MASPGGLRRCWRSRVAGSGLPALMLCACTLIAMMRSASGHAADWGDLTFSELIDWLHLMASTLWGGGLLTLCIVVLPAALKLRRGYGGTVDRG